MPGALVARHLSSGSDGGRTRHPYHDNQHFPIERPRCRWDFPIRRPRCSDLTQALLSCRSSRKFGAARIHPHCYTHGCPCGFAGDPVKPCRCAPSAIARYQKRISGPLLDRIDLHLEVPRIEYEQLASTRSAEPSAAIRARVEAARAVQQHRFAGSDVLTNADMGPRQLDRFVTLDATSEGLLKTAVRQLNLSARAYHRVLKLARTIADLAGVEAIAAPHVAEALQYRPRGVAG